MRLRIASRLTLVTGVVVSLAGPARAEAGVPPPPDGGNDAGNGTRDASAESSVEPDGAPPRIDAGAGGASAIDATAIDATTDRAVIGEGGPGQSLVGSSALSCGPLAGTLNPELLPSCADVCPFGSCVPASEVPAQASSLPNCTNSADKCMPRFMIETLGNVRFKSCHSVGSAEGRCLPSCLPIVSGQLLPVPQDVCLTSERCIPCYNPVSGTDNGVCHVGCDEGPKLEQTLFTGCCGTDGVCLDASLLGAADKARLGKETCGATELCAPKDPNTTNFACEVRGSEPASPGTGAGGRASGGSGAGARDSGAFPGPKEGGSGGAAAAAADDGGCGCRVGGAPTRGADVLMLLLAGSWLLRRRRMLR